MEPLETYKYLSYSDRTLKLTKNLYVSNKSLNLTSSYYDYFKKTQYQIFYKFSINLL
jgi:hypothetical protein